VHGAIGWATGNERIRRFVKASTSYRFRERIRRAVLRTDDMSERARAELTPRFADDLAQLRGLVDGPVPAWLESPDR
jgi:hypothetical protein